MHSLVISRYCPILGCGLWELLHAGRRTLGARLTVQYKQYTRYRQQGTTLRSSVTHCRIHASIAANTDKYMSYKFAKKFVDK